MLGNADSRWRKYLLDQSPRNRNRAGGAPASPFPARYRVEVRCPFLLLPVLLTAQSEWPYFGNDPGAMRSSPLRQINTANVAKLQPAWTFRLGKPGSEAIPLVIEGVLYVNAPDGVYALVPETGELLWKHAAAAGRHPRPRLLARRQIAPPRPCPPATATTCWPSTRRARTDRPRLRQRRPRRP
jgi:hypothetical protein